MINITQMNLNGEKELVVAANDLHEFLRIDKPRNEWLKEIAEKIGEKPLTDAPSEGTKLLLPLSIAVKIIRASVTLDTLIELIFKTDITDCISTVHMHTVEGRKFVKASEVHAALGITKLMPDWIEDSLQEIGACEQDYKPIHGEFNVVIDYYITSGIAEDLCTRASKKPTIH